MSTPMFIPFMGAVITLKSQSRSAFEDALVGIGGPIAGCFSAIACWAIFLSTGQAIFLGLAYVAFFLNLFNMMPMYPLDG
ncbi:site-2 protease family protein, partial [Klebsiella pneumoniae]